MTRVAPASLRNSLKAAPPSFWKLLPDIGLDRNGLDRGVDLAFRANIWPFHIPSAVDLDQPAARPENPGFHKSLERLRTLEKGPHKAWALGLRGRCLLHLRDERAGALLRRALALDPGLSQSRLWLAEDWMRSDDHARGDRRKAVALAETVLRSHPDCAWAYGLRAACRFKSMEIEGAAADIDAAISRDPDRPLFHALRSEILQKYRHQDSIESAARAARLLPESPWAGLHLARTLFNCRGDHAWAMSVLQGVLASSPGHVEARVMYAEALRREGRLKQAMAEYGTLDGRRIRYQRLNAWRGALLRQLGRLPEALSDLDAAVRLQPTHFQSVFERAQVLLRLERFKEAFEDLRNALRLDSTRTLLYRREGEADEFPSIERLLRRAESLYPRDPWPSLWLGECLLARGRLSAALRHLDRAVAADPKCAWARVWRGEALMLSGNAAPALREFESAVTLDPDNPRALGRLGVALSERGRPREALERLDAAILREPQSAWMLGQRGELHLIAGRIADAISDLDRALEHDARYAHAWFWRAVAGLISGEDAAAARLRKALELGCDPDWVRSWLEKARRRGLALTVLS